MADTSSPVTAATPTTAEVVVEAKLVDKKRLYVSWAVTDQSLIAVARAARPDAKVVEARALSGPARAFGFVTFATEEEAAAALAAMNGKTITTEPIQVDFAKAASTEKKPRPNRRGPKKEGGKAAVAAGGAPAKKKEGAKRPASAKKESKTLAVEGNGDAKPKGPKRERAKKAPKEGGASSTGAAVAVASGEAPKSARGPKKENAKQGGAPRPKKEKAVAAPPS